jgi:hypothetical protein
MEISMDQSNPEKNLITRSVELGVKHLKQVAPDLVIVRLPDDDWNQAKAENEAAIKLFAAMNTGCDREAFGMALKKVFARTAAETGHRITIFSHKEKLKVPHQGSPPRLIRTYRLTKQPSGVP